MRIGRAARLQTANMPYIKPDPRPQSTKGAQEGSHAAPLAQAQPHQSTIGDQTPHSARGQSCQAPTNEPLTVGQIARVKKISLEHAVLGLGMAVFWAVALQGAAQALGWPLAAVIFAWMLSVKLPTFASQAVPGQPARRLIMARLNPAVLGQPLASVVQAALVVLAVAAYAPTMGGAFWLVVLPSAGYIAKAALALGLGLGLGHQPKDPKNDNKTL